MAANPKARILAEALPYIRAYHGKTLVTKLKSVGSEVSVGHRPLAALLVVVAIAVLR